jgi:hypothetical protein
MGKPYREELDQLVQTTLETYSIPIDRLKRAVEDCVGHGLVIVASGGSQTAALYLAELHQEAVGHPCRVVTPLVFQSHPAYGQGSVWLLSAGGKNPDILNAGAHAIASGAQSITALVAAKETPLQALLSSYGASRTISFTLSAGGDGFLATNGLWASCLLLDRAYQAAFADFDVLEEQDVTELLAWAEAAGDAVPDWGGDLVGVGDPHTMIGMADLEMRATEAALANVWVTDLRNLGHGRHYWFASRERSTRAVCLATGSYRALAIRTVDLLRHASPVELINVPGQGSKARLASIAFSMHVAHHLGERIQRDPGRPGVPEFGESLYNLNLPMAVRAAEIDHDQQVILAKLGRRNGPTTNEELAHWLPHLDAYRDTLAQTDIPAVVFDFDGTLIESSRRYEPMEPAVVDELHRLLEGGIRIGIATGRGDSCGKELRARLPSTLWGGVAIGYYNGSCIQPLAQFEIDSAPIDPVILEAVRRINRGVLSSARGRCRVYPTQCSISVLDGRNLSEVWCHISAVLRDLVETEQVRVWMSSHSIDVVAGGVSKQNVVSFVASQANCLPEQVLCIGDRGQWPGNDAELLEMPLSLSADECSDRADRCWNLAGLSRRQIVATCYQLRMFDVSDGVLRFRRK